MTSHANPMLQKCDAGFARPTPPWIKIRNLTLSDLIFVAKKLPLRSKKAGRFEKPLSFARSHFIVTRDSLSPSRATTPLSSCF